MSSEDVHKLTEELFNEFSTIPIICAHSHVDARCPAAQNLVDILSYHYYRGLANSAKYEEGWLPESLGPEEKVRRIVEKTSNIGHTTQYSWLISLLKFFFGFERDRLTSKNWEKLYGRVREQAKQANWYQEVIKKSNIEKICLTNRFYEDLENIDSSFIPSFRADELVFNIQDKDIRVKLESLTDTSVDNLKGFCQAMERRFEYFVSHGASSAAISLPPNFQTGPVSEKEGQAILVKALQGKEVDGDLATLQAYTMNRIAEKCREHSIPFQLMIGVLKERYKQGVYQGRDLFSPVSSMAGYEFLFNQFPDVKFLVSVLPDTQVHEMRIYCWLRHNVNISGHWWYQNTPSMIKPDLHTRIEILPDNKMIGYYSDAYKLEFVFPKFRMYKKILAEALAEKVVKSHCDYDPYTVRFTEEHARQIGRKLLYENPKSLLNLP